MFKYKIASITTLCSINILLGCGGDSSIKTNKDLDKDKTHSSLFSLTKASSSTLETHIKNGLYQKSISTEVNYTLESTQDSVAAPTTAAKSDSFSTTITQENNVDEGDRIKYDGEYIYIANNKQYYYALENDSNNADNNADNNANTIKIVRRDNQGDLEKISETIAFEEESSIDSIYLATNKLAVLSNVYNFTPYYSPLSFASEIFIPREQKFNVSLLNVSDPTTPLAEVSYTIDGSLLSSRRIDNTLYVISSYVPYIEGVTYASTDTEKKNNLDKINNTELDALLPSYEKSSGEVESLVNVNNCYLPQNTDDTNGFEGIVTLTTISIDAPYEIESTCINARVAGIYATTKSVYLYGTDYTVAEDNTYSEQSVIHKFSINDNLTYAASGDLDGRFGWHNPSLRFSEDNEYLRVITTEGDRTEGYHHKVNILKENDASLDLVAQLPNDEHPTLIGKINEDDITQEEIKSVRFFEDKAYIVTFLNTDPLYVIDLSNNENPIIAGALEIPGYSSYLHPISDKLLVGIGQNIDINRLTDTNTPSTTPIVEGAKVSLFDVSDITNPTEINSIVYAGGYTPVEFNYHALSYLKTSDGSHRFALPIERWGQTQVTDNLGNTIHMWQQENFLALLEITEPDLAPQIVEVGNVQAGGNDTPNNSWYTSGWDDRSIIHNNDVYYIHGANVWKSNWLSPLDITGPY